ncbi:hypothetical protein [Falsiruegeria mediterranea]|uniref:Uncharacterized protein n=1 Tax=Falsiruegeria mediterranea M17 TaxID=1200281 RepID=A0A2R8C5I6_9RHOB|nr:hypothetical protein [Falsiruegeria mediterranea]SPJ27652.1 hypothetical protein TRM7615_01142 [Falsiruegeria mediterranea M17]
MSTENIEERRRHISPDMGSNPTKRITHQVKAPLTSINGNPDNFFHPAINADAWEAAKEEQGHPITDDRKARIGTPQHLIEAPKVNPLGTIRARIHARAVELGKTRPDPLILSKAAIGHRVLP